MNDIFDKWTLIQLRKSFLDKRFDQNEKLAEKIINGKLWDLKSIYEDEEQKIRTGYTNLLKEINALDSQIEEDNKETNYDHACMDVYGSQE